jgi:hypothetical protein
VSAILPSSVLCGVRRVRTRTALREPLHLIVGLLLVGTQAYAAEVQYNPRVEITGGYDDNANLNGSSANKIKAGSAGGDARLEIVADEPDWKVRLTPAVHGVYLPNESALSSDGEFLSLLGQRTGPRYILGVYGFGSSQSLLKGYLPTAALGSGLGQQEPGATVGNLTSNRQLLGYIAPNYSLQITPRRRLELNASYTDSTYNHYLIDGYTNYRNTTGSAAFVMDATRTGSIALRVLGSQFKPDVGFTTNTYGFETEWDGHFSATKEYYLRVGVNHSTFSATGIFAGTAVPQSTNLSGGLGTHWTYQVTEVFVDLTRAVAPTALGYAVEEKELRLRVARRFTPRFAGFVGARVIIDNAFTGAAINVPSQQYEYGTAGFEWRLTRALALITEADVTHRVYIGPSARSDAIHISLVYEPHRLADGPAITVGY